TSAPPYAPHSTSPLFPYPTLFRSNRRKCCLSVRGEFAVTSKPLKKPFICSRRVRRDTQTAEKAVYLFAVGLARQANRRKYRLSIHSERDVPSQTPKQPFICSRRVTP